jgi:hypothetical protein
MATEERPRQLDDRCVTGTDIGVKTERTPMQKAPHKKSLGQAKG